MLAGLAQVCRRSERIALSYRNMQGSDTAREVDPYRLVFTGNRWYFVALDVAKGSWRTFRADRVLDVRPTGRVVRLTDPPDAARLVAEMLVSDYRSTPPCACRFRSTTRSARLRPPQAYTSPTAQEVYDAGTDLAENGILWGRVAPAVVRAPSEVDDGRVRDIAIGRGGALEAGGELPVEHPACDLDRVQLDERGGGSISGLVIS